MTTETTETKANKFFSPAAATRIERAVQIVRLNASRHEDDRLAAYLAAGGDTANLLFEAARAANAAGNHEEAQRLASRARQRRSRIDAALIAARNRVYRAAEQIARTIDPVTAARTGADVSAIHLVEKLEWRGLGIDQTPLWQTLEWISAYRAEMIEEGGRWVWRVEIPRVLEQQNPADGVYEYRSRPNAQAPNSFNRPSRMGELWARERAELFEPFEAAAIEARLERLGAAGKAILAAARFPDENRIAEMYGVDPYGDVVFCGSDGVWVTPRQAAEDMAGARPWTRAELMAQWDRHASVNAEALEFYASLCVLAGAMGQGHAIDAMANESAAARLCETLQPIAGPITAWVCRQLSVPPVPAPKLMPLDSAVAAQSTVAMLGAHDEMSPDVIYISANADRHTLAHECVHYVLTQSNKRESIPSQFEEVLAEYLARRLPKLLSVNSGAK